MNETAFSFDPDWMGTLTAPFMTNAFLAGLCIALAAGVMGYFTIARHSTFAAHALAHIGLPGATGAVVLGLPVSAGLGVFALGGALVIGALGKKASQREIATGTVLAFATGMGLFFARLSSSASQQMQSILFGSILTITDGQIVGFAVFDVLLLAVLAVIYRPLLFVSTVICLISIWGGLLVSAMFPAPPSFIIVTISTLFWIVAKIIESARRR